MSSETFLDKKSLKKLDNQLQKMITRTGLDRKTEDEVFDKATLRALEKLISDRVIDILDFPISTGKEGNVFRGITPDNKFVAVKIYRVNTSTFKHIAEYIVGDPRFESFHKNRKDIIYAWTQKEFKNLERLKKYNILSPKPIVYYKNVLVMQYLGDSGAPAPMIKDVKIQNPEKVFEKIIEYMTVMYQKARMVHSDLSPFNILYYRKKPYLIDLGQGVLLEHHNSDEFLKRDIKNMVKFFKKYGIQADEDKIYNEITIKK